MKKLNLILNSAPLEKVMSELFEKDKSVISLKYVKNIFTIGRNDDEYYDWLSTKQPDTLFMNLP